MKSMGVNPDEIKSQVKDAGDKFNAIVDHFNKRLDIIEAKLDDALGTKGKIAAIETDNQNA